MFKGILNAEALAKIHVLMISVICQSFSVNISMSLVNKSSYNEQLLLGPAVAKVR